MVRSIDRNIGRLLNILTRDPNKLYEELGNTEEYINRLIED